MARRVSLPSADDLFRRTQQGEAEATSGPGKPAASPRTSGGSRPANRGTVHAVPDQPEPADAAETGPAAGRRPSGRVKHDEKMTVYVTSDELLEIEHARLSLRSRHGLVVDRGRLVREAIALVLADLELNGDDSALVSRLSEDA